MWHRIRITRASHAFKLGMGFVGWAWMIVGTLIILTTGFRAIMGWGSQSWPHVTGHIAQSEIVPVKKSSGATAFYKVKIVYAYSLPAQNGSFFCNDRLTSHGFIDPADDSYTLVQAQRLTRRYSLDSPVDVYYRADNPHWSMLYPGTDAGTFGGVLMGCVLVMLGALIMRRHHLTRRRVLVEMSSSTAGL